MDTVIVIVVYCVVNTSNIKYYDTKIDDKEIYQETQIITGNDTIKTYDIVWKQKN
jgi:hypothetical protein